MSIFHHCVYMYTHHVCVHARVYVCVYKCRQSHTLFAKGDKWFILTLLKLNLTVFFAVDFSHVSDHKGRWEKNGHTPHSEPTAEGDLGYLTTVTETSVHIRPDEPSHQVTKVKHLCVARLTCV